MEVSQEFYDKMMETHHDVKHILEWQRDHKNEDDKKHEEIGRRVSSLEGDRAKVIGGSAVFGALSGFLTKFLFK